MNTNKTAAMYNPRTYETLKSSDKPANPDLSNYKMPASRVNMHDVAVKSSAVSSLELQAQRAEDKATFAAIEEKVREAVSKSVELSNRLSDNEQMMREIADTLFDELVSHQVAVKFERDPELGNLVSKLVRKQSGDVIFQIPPQETMSLMRLLKYMPGAVLNTSA